MLKDYEDAYGHEIFDHFMGKTAVEIIEREDGFIDLSSGPVTYFQTYDEWSQHYKKAMEFVKGRILDIGCGAGRFSLYLQAKGHRVLGIDNSPKAVEVCLLRGLKEVKGIPITRISASLGKFDTILMLGNNFGLMSNPTRGKWLLQRFRQITNDNALIIAESNDIYQTDDPLHLEYHAYNRQRGRMSGQIRLRVRYRKRRTPWFDYLMVSKAEMEDILDGTGWRVRQFIDSDTSSYIAVIEKEQTR